VKALAGAVLSAALGMASAGAPAAAPAAADPHAAAPSLAGKWVLNKEQSEDARAKMRDANGGRRPGGFEGPRSGGGGPGGGHMGGGFGGRGGGMGRRGGGGAPDDRGGMHAFFEPPETLTITQSADEIALDDGQAVHHLHPDGRKMKADGGATEETTRWSGAELVVESKPSRGPKITAAYMLVPDKHQLDVTSRFEGRFADPFTVRRVYDAAPPE
jgi:hypothetical protein